MSKRVWSILLALGVAACALSACQSAAPSVSAPEQTTATTVTTTVTTAVTTTVTDVTTVAPTDLPVSSSTAAPNTGKRPTTTTTVTTTTRPVTTIPLPPSTTYGKDIIVDLGGYEFKYSSPWLQSLQVVLAGFPPLQEMQLLDRAEEVSEQYNCTVKFTSFYPNVENLKIYIDAGKIPADVMEMMVSQMYAAAAAGYLEPYIRLIESGLINLSDARWLQPYIEVGRFPLDWKIYGVRGREHAANDVVRNCVAFNKDLIRAAGKDPDALYDAVVDGKWDFEMLREYSLAVSQKEGAFGITGEYKFLVEGFVWGNGGRILEVDKKGTLVSGLDSEKVQNGLAYLDRLVNEDKTVYLPEELFEEENWGNVKFNAAEYFLEGNTAFLFCDGWAMPQQLRPKARFGYGMLPLPMGPDADGYVNPVHYGMVLSIPAGHKNVEKAGIVLNALMRPIQPGTNERLVQEDWFQEGDTRSMDCWRLCLDNVMFDLGYGVPSMVDYLQHSSARDILWRQTSIGTPDVDFSEEIQAVYSPKK